MFIIQKMEKLCSNLLKNKSPTRQLPTVVNWLQKWCYDLISFRLTGRIRYHLSMQTTIKALVAKIDPRQLARYLRSLIDMQRLSHHPLNHRLFLEEMLISYAMLMAPARSK